MNMLMRILSFANLWAFTELSKYIPDGKLDPLTFQTVMDAANAKYYLAKVLRIKTILKMYTHTHLFSRMCWLKCHLKWLSTWIGTDSDLAFQTCKQRYECNKWDFDSLLNHTVVTQWMIILLICWHFSTIFPFHDAIFERAISRFLSRYTKEFPDPRFFSPTWDDEMVEMKKLRKKPKTLKKY